MFKFEGYIFSPRAGRAEEPEHHHRLDGTRVGKARWVGGQRRNTSGHQRRKRAVDRRRHELEREPRQDREAREAKRSACKRLLLLILWLLVMTAGAGPSWAAGVLVERALGHQSREGVYVARPTNCLRRAGNRGLYRYPEHLFPQDTGNQSEDNNNGQASVIEY